MGDMLSQAEIDALLGGGSTPKPEEPESDGGMLSQSEIDALLGGGSSAPSNDDASSGILSQEAIDALTQGIDEPSRAVPKNQNEFMESRVAGELDGYLTDDEKDVMGEIGNISMGTSATTLYTLLNQKVLITTPKVRVVDWSVLSESYDRPCVGIRVDYKEGIEGSNVLILRQRDVKIISDLMMGGTGNIPEDFELTEIDLSAIGEAMNQMVGSSATSMSQMLNHKVDIDTPNAFILDFNDNRSFDKLGFVNNIVCVTSFRMEIGDLIDSEIMQVLPVDFAKVMIESLRGGTKSAEKESSPPQQAAAPPQQPTAPPPPMSPPPMPDQQQMYQQPMYQQPMYQQPMYQQPMYQQPMPDQQQMYQQPMYQQPMYQQPMYQQPMPDQQQMYQQQMYQQQMYHQQNVNVQPAQFQTFVDPGDLQQQKENIGIIMDVPLEVTVELGRTQKLIKEILDFAPGTVIELDKLAGEPIDILVNGKFIAKGEVVVIDENFGIRITEIVKPEERI